MHALVTGSRNWRDVLKINEVLFTLAMDNEFHLTVMHGKCDRGADLAADRFAETFAHVGVTNDRNPADWPICASMCDPTHRRVYRGPSVGGRRRGETYCPTAGHRRNTAMCEKLARIETPKIVLVFVMPCSDDKCNDTRPHGSHGAMHCANQAQRFNLPIRWFGWSPDATA